MTSAMMTGLSRTWSATGAGAGCSEGGGGDAVETGTSVERSGSCIDVAVARFVEPAPPPDPFAFKIRPSRALPARNHRCLPRPVSDHLVIGVGNLVGGEDGDAR